MWLQWSSTWACIYLSALVRLPFNNAHGLSVSPFLRTCIFVFFFSLVWPQRRLFSLSLPFFITIPFFFCVFCHIRVVYSWLSCMRFGAFFFLSFFFFFVFVRLERITEAQEEAARNSVECACVCVCVRNKKKTNNSSVVASTSDSVSTLYPLFLFFT